MLVGACAAIVALHTAIARPECAAEVTRLFEAGQHVASAQAAEACWEARRDPLLLYFAAQARASAGQWSHAVAWFRRYLAQIPDDAPLRAGAERRLRGILDEVVAVIVDAPRCVLEFSREGRGEPLEFEWPGGEGMIHLERGTWHVRPSGGVLAEREVEVAAGVRVVLRAPVVPPAVARPEWPVTVRIPGALARVSGVRLELRGRADVSVGLRGPSTRIHVGPGDWEVTLRAPRRDAVSRRVQVRGPVELVFEPGLDRATRARIGLAAGLGAASLALATWGTMGVVRGRGALRAPDLDSVGGTEAALQGYGRSVDGAAALAAGLGGLGVAITNALGPRRAVLAIETGAGLVAALGGATWALIERRGWMEAAGEVPRELLVERRPHATAAFVMLGLGAGTAAAGAVSWIAWTAIGRKPERVRRLEPLASPWHVGLRGRF